MIYVTHDQEEALAVSDQIIVMDGGRIAQQGTPHELYEAPASRFLADFIGDANLVDGELARRRRRRDVRAGGVSACRCAPTACAAGPATLAVRPHRLRLVRAGQGADRRASASAPPTSAAAIEYVVATPWGELLVFDADARTPRRARRSRSASRFDPDAVIVLPR